MEDLLGLTAPAPLSITTLTVNLLLSIILSSAVAWYYTQYGKSLSNRARFAQILPLLTLTTVLVISVVKSSLALSLGLVGALSIVRFRTAIKEPEELIYLFIALSIGLGMGADQRLPTILAILVILAYLLTRTWLSQNETKNNLYFNIYASNTQTSFTGINELLLKHIDNADLRRLDRANGSLQATYLIHCPNDQVLTDLMDDFSKEVPDCEISFVEQDNTLGG